MIALTVGHYRALLFRALFLWTVLRGFAAFAETGPLLIPTQFFMMAVVLTAVLFDARRRSELLFLANLGIGKVRVIAGLGLAIVLLELALTSMP